MLEWIVTAERWGEEVAEEEDAEIVFVGGGLDAVSTLAGWGSAQQGAPKGPEERYGICAGNHDPWEKSADHRKEGVDDGCEQNSTAGFTV